MPTSRVTFQLGQYVHAEVRDYGHGNVDIVFVENVYIENVPRKKEFALTLRCWQQLTWCMQDIQIAVKDHTEGKDIHYSYHLGTNRYVQDNKGFKVVEVRQFWVPEGQTEERVTLKGIALKFDEFNTLVKLKAEIEQVIPEMETIQPCWADNDSIVFSVKVLN